MDLYKRTDIDSPCIGICSTSFGDDVCIGCGRHWKEVIDWNTLSDEKKREINHRLSQKNVEINNG